MKCQKDFNHDVEECKSDLYKLYNIESKHSGFDQRYMNLFSKYFKNIENMNEYDRDVLLSVVMNSKVGEPLSGEIIDNITNDILSKVNARFEEMEKRINARLDAKLEEVEKRINARLDAKLEEMEERINARFDAKLEEMEDRLLSKMAILIDQILDKKLKDLKK